MKIYLLCFFWIITVNLGYSQTKETDSLKQVLARMKMDLGYEKDTAYIKTLNELAFQLLYINPDSTRLLAEQSIGISESINFSPGLVDALKNLGAVKNIQGNYYEALAVFEEALQLTNKESYPWGAGGVYQNKGMVYFNLGKYPEALENFYAALKVREDIADSVGIASSINGIGTIYFMQGKYEESLEFYLKALDLAEKFNFQTGIEAFAANIGESMIQLNRSQEALDYLKKSAKVTALTENRETMAFIQLLMGTAYLQQNSFEESARAFMLCNQLAEEIGSQEYLGRSILGLARANLAEGKMGKAEEYSRELLDMASQIGYNELLRDGNELLSKIYEIRGNDRLALFHFKQFKQFTDSINNKETERKAAILAAEYEFSQRELLLKGEQDKKKLEFQRKTAMQRWIIFFIFAALIFTVVIALISYRSRKKEKSTNHLLNLKNEEILLQKQGLEVALSNLKSAQAQLVHSEKMASLGELTAGIAHEIQNPLNFVNNFSELNADLIEELAIEVEKGHLEEVKAIASDLKENEKKINHHGKRAESIVKSMLQHSRTGSGKKEPTNINALADEYLRLAYHACLAGRQGLRDKEKSLSSGQAGFQSDFKAELDPNLPLVDVMPQDISRVLLNLINNAFYAVNEKRKKALESGDESYKPLVTVKTQNLGVTVEISVLDNGSGIPESVKSKIFQPFFTTKPTGQGTGLGLSLSYDIVKAHGGEIKVESLPAGKAGEEGKGTIFTISIPIDKKILL